MGAYRPSVCGFIPERIGRMSSKIRAFMELLIRSGRVFDTAVSMVIRNNAVDYLEGIRSEEQFRKKMSEFAVNVRDQDFIMEKLREIKDEENAKATSMSGMRA